MIVRICMCSCGRFSVQSVDTEPACDACGAEDDDVDWMNVDSEDLERDLDQAKETLSEMLED